MQKKQLRQKQRARRSRQLAPAKPSRKMTGRLDNANEVIRCGD
jgi:hypothetical protein